MSRGIEALQQGRLAAEPPKRVCPVHRHRAGAACQGADHTDLAVHASTALDLQGSCTLHADPEVEDLKLRHVEGRSGPGHRDSACPVRTAAVVEHRAGYDLRSVPADVQHLAGVDLTTGLNAQ